MGNMWRALRHGESVGERRRALELAHERFVDAAPLPDEVERRDALVGLPDLRPVVLDSWLRSRRSTVDPDRAPDMVAFDEEELREARLAHPIARVLPVIQRLLFEEAEESGLLVAVGDASGRLLWVEGDRRLRAGAEEMGFRAGVDWSEEAVGTSAPGSALALDHAIQVLGAEHYNRAVHPWSCTAAPVHDPITGSIVGVLDVTGGDLAASPHLLPLMEATLAAVEAELHLESLRALVERERGRERGFQQGAAGMQRGNSATSGGSRAGHSNRATLDLAPVPSPRLVLLGRDPALLEGAGGPLSLSRRHAEILLALANAPNGLQAANLASQVYGDEAAEQTLRAEVVRLRKSLAANQSGVEITSRPYRLERGLRIDARELLGALSRGAHRLALAGYEGPVLPGSVAPAVEQLRDEVDATLRESLLQSASPDVLFEYAQNWAFSDAEVWETLLRVLPPLSPKRARVVARLEGIAREA